MPGELKEEDMIEDAAFRTLADNISEGAYIVDPSRTIAYWNKGAETISGYTAEEVKGSHCYDKILQHVDDEGCLLCHDGCPLAKTLEDGQARNDEVYLHHKLGHRVPIRVRITPLYDRKNCVIGAVETFVESTDQVELLRKVKELERIAMVDSLTQLGSRTYINNKITTCIDEIQRYDWQFGLIMIDIDFFKEVNDRHGHLAGDEVLKMVSRTLMNNVRPFDLVGRWGGEEFLGVIVNVSEEQLQALADRLRTLVEHSHLEYEGKRLQVTISLGITMAQREDTIESLIKRADTCLYRSKREGRNRVTGIMMTAQE